MKRHRGYFSLADFLSLSGIIFGVAGGLFFSKYFYLAAMLPVFLTAFLRDSGLLNDKDEYQLQASRVAGNTAFRVTAAAVLIFAAGYGRDAEIRELWMFILVFMTAVYLFRYFTYFRGSVRAARTILIASGGFWSLFIILSFHGGILPVLIELAVFPLPLFISAVLSVRYPKISGLIVIVLAMVLMAFVFFRRVPVLTLGFAAIIVLLLFPLIISGFLFLYREEKGSS